MLTWIDATGPQIVLPGFHGEVVAPSPKVQLASKYLWGLKGNVTIIGQQTTRELTVNLWLNDPTWTDVKNLYDFLAGTLELLVGAYGSLNLTNDTEGYWPTHQYQTFSNLLFAGYENVPFPGQEFPTAVKDEAGTLYRSGQYAGNLTWLQNLSLLFLQTLPGRTVNQNP